jgi:hypothetical protein
MGKAITFLPSPLPGEHFLSVIARWGLLQGTSDIRKVIERLSPDAMFLSHKLIHHPMTDDVISLYGSGLIRKGVIHENTLLPYYAALLPYKLIYHIAHQMRYHRQYVRNKNKAVKAPTFTAHYSTVLRFGEKWRWCKLCVSEDETKVGTPYWHAQHQIPSLLHCYRHRDTALSVACVKCGFEVRNLCDFPLPPRDNQCPKCDSNISSVNYKKSSVIAFVENSSLLLQGQKKVLTSPEYSYIMKYGVQGQFSNIVGRKTQQSVFIADRLQTEFFQWFQDNNLGVFFNEDEKVARDKVLDLETMVRKSTCRPPLSILLWLCFLEVEWPSLEVAA